MRQDLLRSLRLLSRRDRRVLLVLVAIQSSLAFLDLAAVIVLGLVISLVTADATNESASFLPSVSDLLGDPPSSATLLSLMVGAGLLLVVKSALSFWGTRRSFQFLANRQAMVGSQLANELLSRPLLQVQKRSSQESVHALVFGVHALTVGVLGQAVIIATEMTLVAVLLTGLLVIDPVLTLFSALFFAGIAAALHFLLAKWAKGIGEREAIAGAASIEAIQEAVAGYREVTVSGRRQVYVERFGALLWRVASIQANRLMAQSIGKYVFEVALVIGAGLLVATQLSSGNVADAVALAVVYLAAATRIMPSLLRLQSAMLLFKISAGTARYSVEMIEDLNNSDATPGVGVVQLTEMMSASARGYPGFDGNLHVEDISLVYPEASHFALERVSISVPPGSSLALVGPSGAGKSSLADIILGVTAPSSGHVTMSGVTPVEAVLTWPGVLGYVPQSVAMVNGTIRQNVAMGLPEELVDESRVREALERARLSSFIAETEHGLDSVVGERGVRLSGGQRQRLGIARALYTRPRLLVMDEATSALDAATEAAISETVTAMSGEVTLIVIAHRLATIRHCDQVVYLDNGRVAASGTFGDVRREVPDFEHQAQLLGL